MAAIEFVTELVVRDLSRRNLNYYNPHYEVVIAVRAVKPHMPVDRGF
jgi:hypothetical protein